MENKEKSSPKPSHNIFESAAANNLLGVSPFHALPYSHLAHLSNAFPLLGHYPAFPVNSLFGEPGERNLTNFSASLASSSETPGKQSSASKTFSSPSKESPKSSPKTITKATTTIATTTTTTFSNSTSSRKTIITTVTSGSFKPGESLLAGKSLLAGRSLLADHSLLLSKNKKSPKLSSSTSTNHAATSHSTNGTADDSSHVSCPLRSDSPNTTEKNKIIENGDHLESDEDRSESVLDLVAKKTAINGEKEETVDEEMNIDMERKNNTISTIHIDGLKKKLIADQIRQRVQNKPIQSIQPSIMQPIKRGRGRPPKQIQMSPSQLSEDEMKQKEAEKLKAQLNATLLKQELHLKKLREKHEKAQAESEKNGDLKMQLEANLKKQQMQLKILKKQQQQKDMEMAILLQQKKQEMLKRQQEKKDLETSLKVQQLLKLSQDERKARTHSEKQTKTKSPSSRKINEILQEKMNESESKQKAELSVDEKLEAKVRAMLEEESNMSVSSSDSDSESDNLSRAESIGGFSDDPHTQSCNEETGSLTSKRSADEMSEGGTSPAKRPRVQMDVAALQVPIKFGFRRTTTIHAIGKRGFIGEVLYFGPCGKKMKTIPDVMRYLERNNISEFGRENFSFNTRVKVGEFYEGQAGTAEIVKLNDDEINERMALIESKRQKMLLMKQMKGSKRQEKQNKQIQLAKQMMEQKLKRRLEQQEMAKRAAEYKEQKKAEKEKQKDMARKIKEMRGSDPPPDWQAPIYCLPDNFLSHDSDTSVNEKKKQKDQLRLLREHEKLQRQEQMRLERELRAQQILEEREMKRHQAIIAKEQERERKRHHFLLVKALEQQKKQAKDKIREDKMAERRIHKEKKMEQRRLELQLARELKKPVEDMELKDHRALPGLPRIPGSKLDAVAFGDCLMVLEFIHNFKDVLGFDEDMLPTLRSLQDQVMFASEEDGEDFMSLTCHLLRYAVHEPGVPNPKEATTCLGQKIADVPITESVVSEVLRVFMIARNGHHTEMSDWLKSKPLESLNASQKASVLAFLVNELNCGRRITLEIEKQLDHMGDIRRDKWVVEGKLRRLKSVQVKKFNQSVQKLNADGDTSMAGDDSMSNQMTCKKGSDEEEEKEEESGNESGEEAAGNEADGEEDEPASIEECEKKIEKLQKQHAQYRAKVFKASHKVRAMSFGQDRYKRRYWVLPVAGGVYVEGLESGFFDEEIHVGNVKTEPSEDTANTELKQEVKSEVIERKDILKIPVFKKECKSEAENCDIENVIKSENSTSDVLCKHELTNQNCEDLSLKSPISNCIKQEEPMCNGDISTSRCNSAMSDSSDSKLQNFSSNKHNSHNKPDTNSDVKPIISSAHASPLISPYPVAPSPFFTSIAGSGSSLLNNLSLPMSSSSSHPSTSTPLPAHQHPKSSTPSSDTKPSFLSIDSLLKKEDGPSSSKSLFPSQMFPIVPLTPDQMIKSFSENSDQKPWFSVLPRMPCDDLSITQGTGSVPPSPFQSSSPFLSPLSFHAFPLQSQTFASFQMGQLYGSPDLSGKSLNATQSPQVHDNFKVPNTPRSETDTPSTSILEQNESILKDLQGEAQPIPDEVQKGWWRVIDEEDVRAIHRNCHPRGIREKSLQKSLQKCMEHVCESCSTENKEACLESESSEEEDDESKDKKKKDDTNTEEETEEKNKKKRKPCLDPEEEKIKLEKLAHSVELQALEEVENLEERVASASLQVKGWKVPQRLSEDSEITLVDRSHTELKPNEKYPFQAARDKLRNLEPNIERRYLKPPLCKAVQINLANITANTSINDHDDENEEKPVETVPIHPGLQTWRNAVANATSSAQLTLCLYQLNNAISWEKSIMKVLCQLCRKDDNEAELLLCDGCDQGYHTYCFKPKMENIPEGDWYCYQCISKVTGEPCCIVCGKRMGRIVECDQCPRAIHLDCLDPPLPRMPRKWLCPACISIQGIKKKGKRSPKKKNSESDTPKARERKDSDVGGKSQGETTPAEKKRGKDLEKRKNAELSEDMTVCRLILTEMDKHEEGWPFLKPVNFKQFPAYKKYIRQPMDFTTMKNKLRDNQYKTRGDFAADVRLIFNNCQTFNEDESEVGRAGHSMRKFFETRWKELLLSSPPVSSPNSNSTEKMEENMDQDQ